MKKYKLICNKFTEKISCLVHGTSIEILPYILATNLLLARKGDPPRMIRGLPIILNKGLYMQAIFNCNLDKPLIKRQTDKTLYLVFSKVLLTIYDDYHISNNWFGGILFEPAGILKDSISKSYTKTQLEKYFEENIICTESFVKNEVVFQSNVDLTYLVGIWIFDYKQTDSDNQIKLKQEIEKILSDRF